MPKPSPPAAAVGAFVALGAVGAVLVHQGGGIRVAELLVACGAAALAAAVGWPVSAHAALGAGAAYLILETLDDRFDAAGAPSRIAVAVLVAAAALLAGRGRSAAPRRTPAATTPWTALEAPPGVTLDLELERARRYRRALSLLVVRADRVEGASPRDLARIVDLVEAVISETVRAVDVVERSGEHRFEIVLPETEAPAARIVAERLRLEIEATRPEMSPDRVRGLSVSIGVACCPVDGTTTADLTASAERALARAVELGGNRTVLHTAPPGSPQGWGLVSGGGGSATPLPRRRRPQQ